MSLDETVYARVLQFLQQNQPNQSVLNNALRLLAKYRCRLIENTLLEKHGTTVMAGPFAGMDYVERASEGCHAPKVLGCYEQELHSFVSALPDAGYAAVLNIGCAEGYYAVGIKRLLPAVRVLAFDIDPEAQSKCRDLAAKNTVEVEVGGRFDPEDFGRYSEAKGRVLVWCDIEGGEIELLDPAKAPALKAMDLVVELHSTAQGHSKDIVPARFAETHAIEIRAPQIHNPVLPPFLRELSDLDRLLAQWEWRSMPTPWAIMQSRLTRPI